MRGGFLHGELLRPFEAHFTELGATVKTECPTRPGRAPGFVDLLALYGSERIVIEAELTADRAPNDVLKAIELEASYLLIVVPHRLIARRVVRRLSRTDLPATEFEQCVLPLGPALAQVRFRFPLFASMNHEKNRKENQSAFQRGEGS